MIQPLNNWRYWLRVAIVIVPASLLAAVGVVAEKVSKWCDHGMGKLQRWDGPIRRGTRGQMP